MNLRDRFGGDGRNRLLWKADGRLGGYLADGFVCSEDELQSLLLFEQVSNVILKGGFLILKLVSFLLGQRDCQFDILQILYEILYRPEQRYEKYLQLEAYQ